MSNWYYVEGSERIGPVDFLQIKKLYDQNSLNEQSYVWKKGFKDWMKICNVPEFTNQIENSKEVIENNIKIENLEFDKSIFENENVDQIFVKQSIDSEIYGPYSLLEIKDAYNQKLINHETFFYVFKMENWKKMENEIFFQNYLGIKFNILQSNITPPNLVVIKSNEKEFVFLVNFNQNSEFVLKGPIVGDLPMKNKVDYYFGNMPVKKNIEIEIKKIEKFSQMIYCESNQLLNFLK